MSRGSSATRSILPTTADYGRIGTAWFSRRQYVPYGRGHASAANPASSQPVIAYLVAAMNGTPGRDAPNGRTSRVPALTRGPRPGHPERGRPARRPLPHPDDRQADADRAGQRRISRAGAPPAARYRGLHRAGNQPGGTGRAGSQRRRRPPGAGRAPARGIDRPAADADRRTGSRRPRCHRQASRTVLPTAPGLASGS